MGAVLEVKASIIDASSRLTSATPSVIRMHLDEIAVLLTKRKRLNAQIADACDRARAINLFPKVLRKIANLRNADREESLKEKNASGALQGGGWLGCSGAKGENGETGIKPFSNNDTKIKLYCYWKAKIGR